MSLTHPVFPPANNAATNLPSAFALINAALRALDGADTLVIDAGATALDTVLPRLPQVLAVHGTPGSLDGSGRFVLRLPSNGTTDQVIVVANRTASPLRLVTSDGANALVASLAAGRIEVFVLSGSTVGAYALSSTRTGKAATAHTHLVSEVAGLRQLRTAVRRASSATALSAADWHSVAFGQPVSTDEIGLVWSDSNRTFTIPAGVSKVRLIAGLHFSGTPSVSYTFSKNGAALTGASAWSPFDGNGLHDTPTAATAWPPQIQTAWIPVSAGEYFRVLVRRNTAGTQSVASGNFTFVSVEAY